MKCEWRECARSPLAGAVLTSTRSNLRQQSVATTEITRLLIAQGPMEQTEELVSTTEVYVPTEPGKYKPQLRASSQARAPERHFVHRRTKLSSRTFMGRLDISEVEERTDDAPATRSTGKPSPSPTCQGMGVNLSQLCDYAWYLHGGCSPRPGISSFRWPLPAGRLASGNTPQFQEMPRCSKRSILGRGRRSSGCSQTGPRRRSR